MARTLRHLTTCCAAFGLLAGCSGGSDAAGTTTAAAPETTEPATTEPATTAAPATTEPAPTTAPATTVPPATVPPTTEEVRAEPDVQLGDTISAEHGLVTMQVADGWSVDSLSDAVNRTYEASEGLTWEPSLGSLVEILSMSRDDSVATPNATMGVFREGRYRLVDSVFEWDSAIGSLLGISPNIDLTVEWGGGRGESTRGRLGERYVRHESVQVGDQFVSVIAVSDDPPSEELDAEVSAMIESIQIDPSAIGLLTHSIDLTVSVSAADSGSTPFKLGVLAPPNWVESEEFNGYWFDPSVDDPEAPLPSLAVYTNLVDGDMAAMNDSEFADRGNDWFAVEPVPESTEIDGVPGTIFWEGDPQTAEAALLTVSDDVVFAAAYIYTPGDTALLKEMVASAQVSESAVNPDGL